jgi:ribosomal-protein-alanine N-acetyltransferase
VSGLKLRTAALDDAFALAQAHDGAFERPWREAEMADLLTQPGVFGYVAGPGGPGPIAGFVLCRSIAGEAEILTIAVVPAARRSGVARALMSATATACRALGAEALFLEVATDNAAAVGLYAGLGFEQAGRRRNYYHRGVGGAVDALVMRLSLNTG